MSVSYRHCTMLESALGILEPIADRFVLLTVWCGFLCKSYPSRACISAHLGGLANACHQPSPIPTTKSDTTTVKSP